MRSVGTFILERESSPAKLDLPLLDTIAAMLLLLLLGLLAAATIAAAVPVLAPKYPPRRFQYQDFQKSSL
jgi:hypothetical protein